MFQVEIEITLLNDAMRDFQIKVIEIGVRLRRCVSSRRGTLTLVNSDFNIETMRH